MTKTKKLLVCVVLLCLLFANTADALLWFLAGVVRAGVVAVSTFVSTPMGQSIVRSAVNHAMVLGGLAYLYFDRGTAALPEERYIKVDLVNTKAAVQELHNQGSIFPGVPAGGPESGGFYLGGCSQVTGTQPNCSSVTPVKGTDYMECTYSTSVWANMYANNNCFGVQTGPWHYDNDTPPSCVSNGSCYPCKWDYKSQNCGYDFGTMWLCPASACVWHCIRQEKSLSCDDIGSPTSDYNTGVACASPSPATTCNFPVDSASIDVAVDTIFTNEDLKKYVQDAVGRDIQAGGTLVASPVAGEPVVIVGDGGTSKEWPAGTSEQEMESWFNNTPFGGSSPSASASDIGSAVGSAVNPAVNAVKTSVDGVKGSVDAVKASSDAVKGSVDGVKGSVDAVNQKVGENPGSASVPSYDSNYDNPVENSITDRIGSFIGSNPIIGAINGSHLNLSGAVCSVSNGLSIFGKPLNLDFCWMESYLTMFGNVLVVFAGLAAALIIFRRSN